MAKVKILKDTEGASDKTGATTKIYRQDEILEDIDEWSAKMGKSFVEMGVAMYIQGNQKVEHTLSVEEKVTTTLKEKVKKALGKETKKEPKLKTKRYRKKSK